MNKKILMATAAVAIMAISGWNVSRSMNEPAMSDVALENVEALASGESILDYNIWIVTIYTYTYWECEGGGGVYCPH
jgi:hypothetical protein